MKKNLSKILLVSFILMSVFFHKTFAQDNNQLVSGADPVILQDGEYFYMYTTGGDNILIHKSQDLIDWEFVGKAFTHDNISTPNKKKWENPSENADYKYYYIWAPGIIKLNNTYILTFSATQSISSAVPNNKQTIWLAWSDSPTGPFGPDNSRNIRMHEPVPIRNYQWGFTNNLPHSELNAHVPNDLNNQFKMRIDSSFFVDAGKIWMLYTWYENGNHNSIVRLNNNDPSLTNESQESFRLTNSSDLSLGETRLGVNGNISVGITEGPEILKINNKYYLFYSVNSFDSSDYSIRYKMANSLACLEYGRETQAGCGVKQGTAFDGFNSNYNYGHGYPFYSPDGQRVFHAITVMSDNNKNNRSIFIVEQEFNSDGTPKTVSPNINERINLNLFNTLPTIYPACGSASGIASVTMPDTSLRCAVGEIGDSGWGPRNGSNSWFWGCVGQNTDWEDDTMWCYAPKIDNIVSVCTENNWQSSLSPTTCPSSSNQTKSWTKVGQCSGGVSHPSTETVSCVYRPVTPTCSSHTYSTWSVCSANNTQSRTLLSSSPNSCSGGVSPVLSQGCTYTPVCTENNWQSSLSPTTCPSSSNQTKSWTKVGQCSGGVSHTSTETVSCVYNYSSGGGGGGGVSGSDSTITTPTPLVPVSTTPNTNITPSPLPISSTTTKPYSSIGDFIQLLITIGIITPDKIPAANIFLASLNTVTPVKNIVKNTNTTPINNPITNKKPLITINLYSGIYHSEVIILKKFLVKHGYLEDVVGTEYYGPQTTEAVKKFQIINGIVNSGTPETTGFGSVGPKTRNMINKLN